jgi:hypothetical protein
MGASSQVLRVMRSNLKNGKSQREGLTMAKEKSASDDDNLIVGGCFLIVLVMFLIFT